MILDTTTRSLEVLLAAAPASTQLPWYSSHADHTASAFTPGAASGTTNGTTAVTLVAAPGGSTQRQVKTVSVYNVDTAPATVTVRLNDSGTMRNIAKVLLAIGESLHFEPSAGWYALDTNGNRKGGSSVWASGDQIGAHAGGSSWETWYFPGMKAATALTTGAPTANVLRAFPFVAPRRGAVLDRIGINVTTLLAGSTRLGIYRTVSESNLYPGDLLLDAGQVDTGTAGVKTLTINQALDPGRIYHAGIVSNAAPTLRCIALAGVGISLLGFGAAFPTTPTLGLSVAFTYAALPTPFPAGAVAITAVPVPVIGLRFSA